MDDGEVETSDHALFPRPNSSSNFHVDTFVKNNTRTCLHTHTCNLPGPAAAHTHTCYHTHTQVLPSEDDDRTKNKEHLVPKPKRRRPSGNREAVRKYREKKKAHTAYLEEEVKNLQLLNQQLVRKLQGQASLEAEFLRLRSLLLGLRGKIDSEFQKHYCELQSTGGETGLSCQTDLPCFCPPAVGSSLPAKIAGVTGKMMVSFGGNCQDAVIECRENPNPDAQNLHCT